MKSAQACQAWPEANGRFRRTVLARRTTGGERKSATLNYHSLLRFVDESTWWVAAFFGQETHHAGLAGRLPRLRLSSITREGSNAFAEASSMWPRGLQTMRVFLSR
jgi:hypothetical protein